MADDTIRGNYPNKICSDCGGDGVCFKYWGPLIPPGKVGNFCGDCFDARKADRDNGRPVRPLGAKAENVSA